MIINGVDTSALPPLFDAPKTGRVLIVDGDGPIYVAAATSKRLDTAIRKFQQDILAQLFLTRCDVASIHLTSRSSAKNNRHLMAGVRPYQHNRKGKAKPPLVEPLREAMALHTNWLEEFLPVTLHREFEADDGCIIEAYQLKEQGIVWSDDKDLRMTPYLWWDRKKAKAVGPVGDGVGTLYLDTSTTTTKCLGHGPVFFWAQLLMGDNADGIVGLERARGQRCGPAMAYSLLAPCRDITEVANTVVSLYRESEQNIIPEAYMLWLLRWPGDHVATYMRSLDLTQQNREFVEACLTKKFWREPDNGPETSDG